MTWITLGEALLPVLTKAAEAMTRYQCPEAQRRYKIARRLYRWRDQAYDRRAFDRSVRLNDMANDNKRRANDLEQAWHTIRWRVSA